MEAKSADHRDREYGGMVPWLEHVEYMRAECLRRLQHERIRGIALLPATKNGAVARRTVIPFVIKALTNFVAVRKSG